METVLNSVAIRWQLVGPFWPSQACLQWEDGSTMTDGLSPFTPYGGSWREKALLLEGGVVI